MTIYTVGHSTRTLAELMGVLKVHEVQVLVDIRSFPASARHPHFNKESLEQALPQNGIEYVWLGKELGGYRKRKDPNSPHTALRSPGFRNYADHMATRDFEDGITQLLKIPGQKRVTMMCAERLWWRCHRSLVSDYLTACCGVEIVHITEEGKTEPHRLHRAARLVGGKLVYDVATQPPLL